MCVLAIGQGHVVVLGVQTGADTRLVHLVARVVLRHLGFVDNVLLELVWLVHAWLHWNLLHRLLTCTVIDVLVRIDFDAFIVLPLGDGVPRHVLALFGAVTVSLAR